MYNVLVCDDEKDIVSALQIYLKSEGYQVFSAYNGKEALKIINREDIQLVLMDIMMPEMDGIEAMCKIREISNVPVILLTAKSEDTDKVLGLTVGADDYVTKPFNPVELQARVKSQIRRYMLLGSGQKVRTKLSAGGIRLNSDKFPDSVSEIVFQQENGITQFSPVSDGSYDRVQISEETVRAVGRALDGEDISEGALYFAARDYADSKRMRWFDEKLTLLFRHGGHEFFKE